MLNFALNLRILTHFIFFFTRIFQEAFDRTGRILNIVVTPNNSSDPPRLLNYLTAPHVLVWSAAVASASLPGVFEANRLMVKDADGTERYESAAGQHFSDGSMEQDLPMQQLSEMFVSWYYAFLVKSVSCMLCVVLVSLSSLTINYLSCPRSLAPLHFVFFMHQRIHTRM